MTESSPSPAPKRRSIGTAQATVIAAAIGAIASIIVAFVSAREAVNREAPKAVEIELKRHESEIDELKKQAAVLKEQLSDLARQVVDAKSSIIFTEALPIELQLGDSGRGIKVTAERQAHRLQETFGTQILAAVLIPNGDVYRISGMDEMRATAVKGTSGNLDSVELLLSGKPYGDPGDNKILQALLIVHYRKQGKLKAFAEQSDAPKSPIGREFESQGFGGDWVIAGVLPVSNAEPSD